MTHWCLLNQYPLPIPLISLSDSLQTTVYFLTSCFGIFFLHCLLLENFLDKITEVNSAQTEGGTTHPDYPSVAADEYPFEPRL